MNGNIGSNRGWIKVVRFGEEVVFVLFDLGDFSVEREDLCGKGFLDDVDGGISYRLLPGFESVCCRLLEFERYCY